MTARGAGHRMRSLLAALAATGAALACAPAAEAYFVAAAADPAGDSTDPSPGRDLTGIGLSYDRRTGALMGAVRFRGDPTEETSATLALFAGTRTASGCDGTPAVGFGSYSTEYGASWLRLDDPAGVGPRGDAEKFGGNTDVQEFNATDQPLAGQSVDCAVATLAEPGNPANIYDTAGPLDLVGLPALALKIAGVPRNFAPGRPRKIKLELSNDGDAPTGPIRLKSSRARGLTVKAKRTLKSIPPGDRRTVKATVTLSGRARTTTDFKVTATAGAVRVRAETTLAVRTRGGGGGGGGGDVGRTCTRYIGFPDGGGSLILVPC